MRNTYLRLPLVILAVLLVFQTGCVNLGKGTSQTTRFYLLNPMSSSGGANQIEESGHGLAIGVGPVRIPEYLNRPQIVTRSKENECYLAEFHQWAESLKETFPRVLAENLSILLATDRVTLYPWKRPVPVDYQILVEVIQFDGQLGGSAKLVARCSIFSGNGKKVFVMRKSSFSELSEKQGYDALVAAKSRAVAYLSRDIATAIKAVSQENAASPVEQ